MSADQLRRAASAMRREHTPFLDAVADLLDEIRPLAELYRADRYPVGVKAVAVAEAFSTDPGDVPETVA